MDKRHLIAKRAARYFQSGDVVNLGIGIPSLCGNYAEPGVLFQAENGFIGVGATAEAVSYTHLVEAGAAAACERVWELPCDENLRRVLDSRVAHLKNSAMGSNVGGYATVGAMFIKEFAEDTPWVHLDIGGTAWTTECEGIYTCLLYTSRCV